MSNLSSPGGTSFAQRLREGPLAIALEITPPQTFLPKVLARRATFLVGGAQAINVIQRPGRMSSLDAAAFLRQQGMDPVWHLVVRGRPRDEIAADLDRAAELGISQVLCILGDHPAEPGADPVTVRDVVRMASGQLPDGLVGATFNQYAPGQDRAIANLFGKLEAGATYVQTQPVFDPGPFFRAAERIDREFPGIPVVPMVMPLLEPAALDRLHSRLGVAVPDGFKLALAAGTGAAWEAFDRLLDELLASPLVRGLAIMTFEMDAPSGVGRRLLETLVRAGAATPADVPEAGEPGER